MSANVCTYTFVCVSKIECVCANIYITDLEDAAAVPVRSDMEAVRSNCVVNELVVI